MSAAPASGVGSDWASRARASSCAGVSPSPRAYVHSRSRLPAAWRTWNPTEGAPAGRSRICSSVRRGRSAESSSRDCNRLWATGCRKAGMPGIGPRSQTSGAGLVAMRVLGSASSLSILPGPPDSHTAPERGRRQDRPGEDRRELSSSPERSDGPGAGDGESDPRCPSRPAPSWRVPGQEQSRRGFHRRETARCES